MALASALVTVASSEREARAQAVTANPVVFRYYPNNNPYPIRSQNLTPQGINFQDCVDNINLVFSLNLTMPGPPNTLQAWAGASDCSLLASRTATTATCWPLVLAIAQSNPATATIRAQDLVDHIGDNPKPVNYVASTGTACTRQVTSGATTIGVYFFFADASGNPVGTSTKVDVPISTQGPSAPSNVSVQFGDTLLIAKWTAPNDKSALAYNVFCDPPRGEEDAGPVLSADAGGTFQTVCTQADGGFSDAATEASPDATIANPPVDGGCMSVFVPFDSGVASTCPSKLLVSGGGTVTGDVEAGVTTTGGIQKAIDPKYRCGGGNGSISGGATIEKLKNGVEYTIAVAGTDAFGNNGPLSTPGCETPQAIDDFWTVYKGAGGGAGGSFCALEGVGVPAGTSVFTLGMITAMVALLRRRRSR